MLPHKPFYYIRHGQTDWNKNQKPMGHKDIPLNETGVKQAHKAVSLLKGVEFTSIVTSPLLRAKKTAEIIAEAKDIPLTVVEELKENSWGVLEGEVKGIGSWLDKWRDNEPIEGAEPYSEFSDRIISGMQKILEIPGPILIVSHGGVYSPIQKALQIPFDHIDNCVPLYHRPPAREGEPWFVCSLGEV